MSSYRFAVFTILSLLLAPASLVGAPPTCDDPAASPTRLITWQQPHLAFEAAFDSNHVFLTEFNLVHRYALNGGAEASFLIVAFG